MRKLILTMFFVCSAAIAEEPQSPPQGAAPKSEADRAEINQLFADRDAAIQQLKNEQTLPAVLELLSGLSLTASTVALGIGLGGTLTGNTNPFVTYGLGYLPAVAGSSAAMVGYLVKSVVDKRPAAMQNVERTQAALDAVLKKP